MSTEKKGISFCSVTTHDGHTRLVNDPTGTLSVLFDHMQTKLATVHTSIKDCETIEGARMALIALEDVADTIRACSQAFTMYDSLRAGEEE